MGRLSVVVNGIISRQEAEIVWRPISLASENTSTMFEHVARSNAASDPYFIGLGLGGYLKTSHRHVLTEGEYLHYIFIVNLVLSFILAVYIAN